MWLLPKWANYERRLHSSNTLLNQLDVNIEESMVEIFAAARPISFAFVKPSRALLQQL